MPASLSRLEQRFAAWREKRVAGQRIPESLWNSAVKMAIQHGVSRTASLLKLDYYSLKKRAEDVHFQHVVGLRRVATRAAVDDSECVIEWEDVAGARMRRATDRAEPSRFARVKSQLLECRLMLQITPQMKILVAVEPADFRKGIDGLAALCKTSLEQDPFGGTVFVFRNRGATAIKVGIILVIGRALEYGDKVTEGTWSAKWSAEGKCLVLSISETTENDKGEQVKTYATGLMGWDARTESLKEVSF